MGPDSNKEQGLRGTALSLDIPSRSCRAQEAPSLLLTPGSPPSLSISPP